MYNCHESTFYNKFCYELWTLQQVGLSVDVGTDYVMSVGFQSST